MIYECVTQLRGECGERQVKNPRLGMAHNVGGPGAVACVVILGHAGSDSWSGSCNGGTNACDP